MTDSRIQPLAIQKYIKLSQAKEVISFAAGLPDLSVLPVELLKGVYHQMTDIDSTLFQYQGPQDSLKKKIQSMMAAQSLDCSLDEILITSGAQQAIYLTANLLFRQKASLMIEEFVYPGFLQIANMFELNYLPIHSSFRDGVDLNHLETVIKTHNPLPYFYMVCNGHNPQGNTFSTKARKELAYLADKYNFIIVEDDPYGRLDYTEEQFLPMRAYTKNAIYIGSFSKIIAPSLRIGWIIADKKIINNLQNLKDMNDLCVFNFNHLVLTRLLDKHILSDIIHPQKICYKHKLDTMISALHEFMKVPFNYVKPQHGMFLWIEFPTINIEQYQDWIFEQSKVLCIPASAFSTKRSVEKQALRLNFTFPSCEEIVKGINLLSASLTLLGTRQKT